MDHEGDRVDVRRMQRQKEANQAARHASWAGGIMIGIPLIIVLAALRITSFWIMALAALIIVCMGQALGASARDRILNK